MGPVKTPRKMIRAWTTACHFDLGTKDFSELGFSRISLHRRGGKRNTDAKVQDKVMVRLFFLVAAFSLSAISASAQFRQPTAELTPTIEQQVIRAGQNVTLVLSVELPDDIHVQSDQPRDPYVIPTLLSFTLPEGLTVEEITYPESTDFLLEDWDEPLAVFDHEFTIEVQLALDADLSPGEVVVPGSFLYQACDDRICFPPKTAGVEWRMDVQAALTP